MRLAKVVALFGIGILSSCGGSGSTDVHATRVDPSAPLGTIWGQVVKAGDHLPLAKAKVSLSAAKEVRVSETREDGLFVFSDVPAGGQVGISIELAGYSKATFKTVVPGQTGDFPAEGIGAFVGPIALFPLDSELNIQLLGHDGRTLNKVAARAVANPAWVDIETGSRQGLVSVNSVSEEGNLIFARMPNLWDMAMYGAEVRFSVEPVVDDSGALRYLGKAVTFTAAKLAANNGRATITLDPPGDNQPLRVIASNVGSLLAPSGRPQPGDSVVDVTEAIRIAFNQPVDPKTVSVTVVEHGMTTSHPSIFHIDDSNVIRILPDGRPYSNGRGYYLLVEVQALGTGSSTKSLSVHGSFFASSPAEDVKVAGVEVDDRDGSGDLNAGDYLLIELSQTIGHGDGSADFEIPVFLDFDLNGSEEIGDAPGEVGHNQPIWANVTEPTPPAPHGLSGFSRFYRLEMPAVVPEGESPAYAISSGSTLRIQTPYSLNHADYRPPYNPAGMVVSTPKDMSTVTIDF